MSNFEIYKESNDTSKPLPEYRFWRLIEEEGVLFLALVNSEGRYKNTRVLRLEDDGTVYRMPWINRTSTPLQVDIDLRVVMRE